MPSVRLAMPALAAGAMVRGLMMERGMIFSGEEPICHALWLRGPASGMQVPWRVRLASRLRVLGVPKTVAWGAAAGRGKPRELI